MAATTVMVAFKSVKDLKRTFAGCGDGQKIDLDWSSNYCYDDDIFHFVWHQLIGLGFLKHIRSINLRGNYITKYGLPDLLMVFLARNVESVELGINQFWVHEFTEMVDSPVLERLWRLHCEDADPLLWEPFDDGLRARLLAKFKSTFHD